MMDNSDQDEMNRIIEKASLIDPVEIQIYTVSRYPSETCIEPVEENFLRNVTEKINYSMGKKCARTYL
jgi:wyosine [tRNA(Phe)-imidazoG37] synthetase (radical SAM superfamily)